MLTPDFTTMVAALALTSFLVGFHLGPIFAIAQTVARPSMRALASAIILLTATCFGQGVGPLAVGMINDALKNDYGANAVRYSLLSAAVTTTLGALLFVWAARSIRGRYQAGELKRALFRDVLQCRELCPRMPFEQAPALWRRSGCRSLARTQYR